MSKVWGRFWGRVGAAVGSICPKDFFNGLCLGQPIAPKLPQKLPQKIKVKNIIISYIYIILLFFKGRYSILPSHPFIYIKNVTFFSHIINKFSGACYRGIFCPKLVVIIFLTLTTPTPCDPSTGYQITGTVAVDLTYTEKLWQPPWKTKNHRLKSKITD